MDDQVFRKKMEALIRQMDSPRMEFGHVRDGVRKQLQELLARASDFGSASVEWGRLNYYIAMLEGDDADDLQEHLQAALDANAASPFLDPEQVLWAEVRIASADLVGERADVGRARLEAACQTLRSSRGDLEPRVAILQRIAFLLHEYGQYEAALNENRRTLDFLKQSPGAVREWETPFQQNIAENLYSLQRIDESLAALEALQVKAQEREDYALWTQALFKQAVLAHERGEPERAEHLLVRCVEVANQSQEDMLIEQAKTWLFELRQRLDGVR